MIILYLSASKFNPKPFAQTMKKQALFLALAGFFFFGLLVSCGGDPRKNCNHPDHGKYMQEKRMKKSGF